MFYVDGGPAFTTIITANGFQNYSFWLLRLRKACTFDRSCVALYTTRSPAIAKIAYHTGCQRPSRSSKVDCFHCIWKGVCHFLLVINSNHGPISYHLRYGQLSVENEHFFLPPSIQPNFDNVSLALDRCNLARLGLIHIANYSFKHFPPKIYPLAKVHSL